MLEASSASKKLGNFESATIVCSCKAMMNVQNHHPKEKGKRGRVKKSKSRNLAEPLSLAFDV